MMLSLYRGATLALAPLMPLYLKRRQKRGKEDGARLQERLGYASLPRPQGRLCWLHAASVGEANAVLPLLAALRENYKGWHCLLTTGTVTSAKLMSERLPKEVIHQFVPVDTPQAVARFFAHWQPQAAILVESELWPNLMSAARCPLALVNARMSEHSFRGWQRFPGMIGTLLGSVHTVAAQSQTDAERYRALGAARVLVAGNLKYDAPPLEADAAELQHIMQVIGNRPCWLAASTHEGEDMLFGKVHSELRKIWPEALLVIVPRHPARGAAIAKSLSGWRVAQRSTGGKLEAADIYIADTLGELGLWYRAIPRVVMGGSFIPHGGQNPLEPVRLGAAVACGPYMFNFAPMLAAMLDAEVIHPVKDAQDLMECLREWLQMPEHAAAQAAQAQAWAAAQGGAVARTLDYLKPVMEAA